MPGRRARSEELRPPGVLGGADYAARRDGRGDIAQLSTRREQIDREVADILERKTNEWASPWCRWRSATSRSPTSCRNRCRPRRAPSASTTRALILAEVEKEISEMFVDAARTYGREDAALQLRAMSFVSDSVREKGGLVVIPAPCPRRSRGWRTSRRKPSAPSAHPFA